MTNEFINEQKTHTSITSCTERDLKGQSSSGTAVRISIELPGTEVAPRARAELADKV
jgi:hypothetical protein